MPSILLVEDDPEVRDSLHKALIDRGEYVVTALSEGELAFQLLAVDPKGYDLVITDMLPLESEVDGIGLLRLMRAHPGLANVPAILYTDYHDASLVEAAAHDRESIRQRFGASYVHRGTVADLVAEVEKQLHK